MKKGDIVIGNGERDVRGELEQRMLEFGRRIVVLARSLPRDAACGVLARQVTRSGTAIGANYREASHASSRRHFVSVLEIAQREAAETTYWLDLIACSELTKPTRLVDLQQECQELLRILTAAARSAKKRNAAQTSTTSDSDT